MSYIVRFLTTCEAVWYVISVVYVCMYVSMYLCQVTTFENLDVEAPVLR